jgi:ABC-type bacteriocin/lantibiotic exporter with double-glycine peptidase domain
MVASCPYYEPQLAEPGTRACGAAALAMAYRSLGLACSQEQIWQRIASRSPRAGVRANSLAADAIAQGLAAIVLQTHQPWRFLEACAAADVRVILNHRLARYSPWGHFTLLEQIEEQSIWLHDPQYGPHRCLAKEELLHLWQGCPGRTEIAGQVAIVIDQRRLEKASCLACRSDVPASLRCAHCKQQVPLQPVAVLGCFAADCPHRLWRQIFCPHCDWAVG